MRSDPPPDTKGRGHELKFLPTGLVALPKQFLEEPAGDEIIQSVVGVLVVDDDDELYRVHFADGASERARRRSCRGVACSLAHWSPAFRPSFRTSGACWAAATFMRAIVPAKSAGTATWAPLPLLLRAGAATVFMRALLLSRGMGTPLAPGELPLTRGRFVSIGMIGTSQATVCTKWRLVNSWCIFSGELRLAWWSIKNRNPCAKYRDTGGPG